MKITGEPAWRLIALLRLVERGPFEPAGEDVALDAWFGPKSPGDGPHRPWTCLRPGLRAPYPPGEPEPLRNG
ncbi:hypothetical protein Kfla_1547 [Kribbella flavida DSM 17836]|uniref:Uncharacterized protein n=1 Tax=Kribbella flavida (strain DSM 17836 / JCM 10339 / NBRC 14399) TaxID=479435 RepID=D2PLL6_KRIFD|nr:hypothetical protein [Kribbella flavida]ADB30645.1 hypothetical protein Kfla_1547 [Kribbella flavida DSM 17836]